jgi:hypothetical protein
MFDFLYKDANPISIMVAFPDLSRRGFLFLKLCISRDVPYLRSVTLGVRVCVCVSDSVPKPYALRLAEPIRVCSVVLLRYAGALYAPQPASCVMLCSMLTPSLPCSWWPVCWRLFAATRSLCPIRAWPGNIATLFELAPPIISPQPKIEPQIEGSDGTGRYLLR